MSERLVFLVRNGKYVEFRLCTKRPKLKKSVFTKECVRTQKDWYWDDYAPSGHKHKYKITQIPYTVTLTQKVYVGGRFLFALPLPTYVRIVKQGGTLGLPRLGRRNVVELNQEMSQKVRKSQWAFKQVLD